MSGRVCRLVLAFLELVLVLVAQVAVTAVYVSQAPVGTAISNTFTFTCSLGGKVYVFEVNTSFYSIWFVDYVNPINISIRAVGESPRARVRTTVTVDKAIASKFLGYVETNSTVRGVIELPLTGANLQMSSEREIKGARLDINIDDLKCSYTTTLWVVIALSIPALNIAVTAIPKDVEVNKSISIRVTLDNPGIESLTNVVAYTYINGTLINTTRFTFIEPASSRVIDVGYTPVNPGLYVVEVRAVYTSPRVQQDESKAVTTFRALVRPLLRLKANTSIVYVGGAVLLEGFIEPKTNDPKVVVLKYSLDGLDWHSIASLHTVDRFNYMWIPEKPGLYMFRFDLEESQTMFQGRSNVVSITVEKVRPSISISPAWPFAEAGSKILISVSVKPLVVNTIELYYRQINETTWRKTAADITKETSTVELVIDRPGVYEVKAVVPETDKNYMAESNTIQLYVREPKTTTTPPTTPQEIAARPQLNVILVTILIAVATAIAILLLALRRR